MNEQIFPGPPQMVKIDGSKVRTMMGVSPSQAAEFMEKAGVDMLAQNCGTGVDMEWAARVLTEYSEASSLPLMAQANAGTPVLKDMQIRYMQAPEEMAAGIPGLVEAGARIIMTCGTCTRSMLKRPGKFRCLIMEQPLR